MHQMHQKRQNHRSNIIIYGESLYGESVYGESVHGESLPSTKNMWLEFESYGQIRISILFVWVLAVVGRLWTVDVFQSADRFASSHRESRRGSPASLSGIFLRFNCFSI